MLQEKKAVIRPEEASASTMPCIALHELPARSLRSQVLAGKIEEACRAEKHLCGVACGLGDLSVVCFFLFPETMPIQLLPAFASCPPEVALLKIVLRVVVEWC